MGNLYYLVIFFHIYILQNYLSKNKINSFNFNFNFIDNYFDNAIFKFINKKL